jgi:hypothetical protein
MGLLDSAKEKAEQLIKDNPEKVEELSDQAITKGGDALDSATGGTFSDQIDAGQAKADEMIGEG